MPIIGLTSTTAVLGSGIPYKLTTLFSYTPFGATDETMFFDPTNTIMSGTTSGIVVEGTSPDYLGLDGFNIFGTSIYGDHPNWNVGTITFPAEVGNSTTETVEVFISWGAAGTSYAFSFTVASLFTSQSEVVNFNSLSSQQQAAVSAGAETNNGLGGSDVVTLNASHSTFSTGSLAGDHYTVSASAGDYNIALGAGSDSVNIIGNGNSTIAGGTGADTISISGTGTNIVNAGAGSEALYISGGGSLKVNGPLVGSATIGAASTLELNGTASGGSIAFTTGGKNETLRIDGTAMPTNVISGFVAGDSIDLANVTLSSTGYTLLQTTGNAANILHVIENGVDYKFQLDQSQNVSGGFSLSDDGTGHTLIKAVANEVAGNKFVADPVVGSPIGAKTDYSTSPTSIGVSNPFGAVVQLIATKAGGVFEGSGFLVHINGQTAILTAAHVLQDAQSIKVYSADHTQGDGANPIVTVSPGNFRLAGGTVLGVTNPATDYGLINIPPGVDFSAYGTFALETGFSGGTVYATGYEGTPPGFSLNNVTTQFSDLGTETIGGLGVLINGSLVTTQGYSGGPVWIFDGTTAKAVGIVSIGAANTQLTADDIAQFQNWINSFQVASAGTSVSNQTVASGNTLQVYGSATNIVVASAAFENVYGTDFGATILDGGYQFVLAGASAINTLLTDPGVQVVSSGGIATSTMISGGEQDVYGTASGSTIASGGLQIVESGGTALDDILGSGGIAAIYAGGVANASVVSNGGLENVYGSGSRTVISAGGLEVLYSGSVAVGTTVSNGGVEYVASGGKASGSVLSAGAQQLVYGLASGTQVQNGGQDYAQSGGVIVGAAVLSGGVAVVQASGTIGSATVSNGGTLNVLSGGMASSNTVQSGGLQTVYGKASGTLVASGGEEFVVAGASVSGTRVSGGIEVVSGAMSGASVVSGTEYIYTSGSDFGASIGSGGLQVVFTTATSAVVSGGGEQYVASGGIANATTISSGGLDVVFGTQSGATVSTGGSDYTLAGGRQLAAKISGGVDVVFGSASGTTVSGAGATEYVYSGGSDSSSVIGSGGLQVLFGSVTSAVVSSGGEQYVASGGVANGTRLNAGAYGVVFGIDSAANISSGATEYVFGSAVSAVISSGGFQVVESGGVASGTAVLKGGTEYDFGAAKGGTVGSGGSLIVEAGASASGVTVSGTEYDFGSTTSTTVQGGGFLAVEAGATASGLNINSGGVVYVISGGAISSVTLSGGTMELTSGASVGSSPIVFATSAHSILQLDASQSFGGSISGFGQPSYLDLSDIAFNSATTTVAFAEAGNNTSGTLTVTDGTHTAHLTLLGQYVTAQFTKQSDGHGGTLIGDPPVTIAATTSVTIGGKHN